MQALVTLLNAGLTHNKNGFALKEYNAKNSDGELIATVQQRSEDGNIHRIMWVGGERHGKSTLTEGGIDGLMDELGRV